MKLKIQIVITLFWSTKFFCLSRTQRKKLGRRFFLYIWRLFLHRFSDSILFLETVWIPWRVSFRTYVAVEKWAHIVCDFHILDELLNEIWFEQPIFFIYTIFCFFFSDGVFIFPWWNIALNFIIKGGIDLSKHASYLDKIIYYHI